MVAFAKTTWLTILLVALLLAAGILVYQWSEKNGELTKQIELNENLTNQVYNLQKESEEERVKNAAELAKQIEANQNLREQVNGLQKEFQKLKSSRKEGPQVTITTDKIKYKHGELMKIIVRNSLDNSIWYADIELGGWNPWWGLQRLEKGNWVEVKVHKTIGGECLIIVRERVPIEELIKEMETNGERSDTWTLENCVEVSPIGPDIDLKPLALGTYRLFFKYGLSKGSWDEKTAYSDKFVVRGD